MGNIGDSQTVMLVRTHTVNGVKRQPGFVLALPNRTAEWLIEQGIARASTSAPGTQAQSRRVVPRGCCGRW
jgi:hypothetical protein